jgi:hypothetical protein
MRRRPERRMRRRPAPTALCVGMLTFVYAAPAVAQAPAWTIEPVSAVSGDSDGNRGTRLGGGVTVAAADSVRLGISILRLAATDDWSGADSWQARLTAAYRPLRRLSFEAAAGAVRVRPDAAFDGTEHAAPWTGAVASARVRWRPTHGPAVDLRMRHEPLAASPLLLASAVTLTEARATTDLPVGGPLFVRGMARLGALREPATATAAPAGHVSRASRPTNRRTTWAAGPLLRSAGGSELSVLYARTSYESPSLAGYFAPARIDAIDAGIYHEHYGWWPLTLALDIGGGVDRVTPHDAATGSWQPTLRLWSQTSWAASDRTELLLELEAYRTQVAQVAASPGTWQWGSVSLGVAWRR